MDKSNLFMELKKVCNECDERYNIGEECPNEPHTAIHRYRKLLKQVEECRKKEEDLLDEMDSVWELLSEKETELLNKESFIKFSKGLEHKYDESVEKLFPLTQEDVNNIINVSTDKLVDIMKSAENKDIISAKVEDIR